MGEPGVAYVYTATISPQTTTMPVTYTWEATGQIPVVNLSGIVDVVAFTWAVVVPNQLDSGETVKLEPPKVNPSRLSVDQAV